MSTTTNSAPQIWTIGKLLELSTQFLASKGIPQARVDAEILLSHVLAFKRIQLYMHIDDPVADADRSRLRDLVKRRSDKCPCAHLVGYREFHLHRFKVSNAVLIPRPETELLVEEAIRLMESNGWTSALDVGTGSGILPITISKAIPAATCIAIDVSEDALAIAQENARALGVEDRIQFRSMDVRDAFFDAESFDVIVSNPPYIPSDEIATLESDVRDYEPKLALDGGSDGLDIVRVIVERVAGWLKPNGMMLMEIGAGQSAAVEAAIAKHPQLECLPTKNDLNHIPRVVAARRKAG